MHDPKYINQNYLVGPVGLNPTQHSPLEPRGPTRDAGPGHNSRREFGGRRPKRNFDLNCFVAGDRVLEPLNDWMEEWKGGERRGGEKVTGSMRPLGNQRWPERTSLVLPGTKLAGKPTKILAIYLLSGGLRVLMAGDLNAKHVDWNSRLTIVRGKLLGDYADRHSCLIHGPDSPTTVPYNPSAIAVTKNLPTPVHLTACSALSSDHLSIMIDNLMELEVLSSFKGGW